MDLNEQMDAQLALSRRVGELVKERYGLDDGGDLAFNLYDTGVIPLRASVYEAAQIVAQYLVQL